MQIHDGQPVLTGPTDTAVPSSPIPIFYIHRDGHAFCGTPGCFCAQYADDKRALLWGILTGKLLLRQAVNGAVPWHAADGGQ